ncbi:MAG TPA: signal recognition particle-docking protein FtsY [Methanothermobacter sp.]|uniref:Signal recognition particle receptor FtsY n=1 Tax=Methanothermobacter tenebrarum TaxID=680118 RepID=A0ABN6PGL9_9EURY|nr:signal recognition particle-docking protein FtsY [Methanothermobacter tenebrarum]MDD3454389.1 signal recognition particle-docking protein FtsY [Methanobacteriales archaeon]MDX9692869.1 signal recognition particle-docking protein FtsY [Methanothermobacter sp.]BDH79981.1 signal recognition particle-docking protein FtsY [Methanothermobacter tenebrarum]HHW16466.1 signal recognition particle-docking protein FtsY [Methanothermobacter sp.]HOQ19776.1 signal recognition particle-docking protein FtsY
MFEALKKKINKTITKITKKISDKEKTIEEPIKEPKTIEEETEEKTIEESIREPETIEEEGERFKIFSFIREKTISEKDIEDVLWDLEMSLLESDVAIDVAEKITKELKKQLVGKKVKRSTDIIEYTQEALKNSIKEILTVNGKDINKILQEKKNKKEPFIIMFVGINGTGKTTTIAKMAKYFLDRGLTPVIAASDTFRAGAIEQLTHHAEKLGVKIIKHEKGADPAAVAFDAVEHARAKGKDVVLIDTAGRMQTNVNLMDEMAKIKRVVKPDFIIFVGDSLTGNDAVEQAIKFDESVGVDAIILTKADADAKGGAALSIGYVINKPIIFLGTGQGYEDLVEFKPEWMIHQLFT